jgi:hypothetical protein
MRIGIHTGLVVAGSVGTSERLKYTTVGDAVNTAARLESLDRDIVQETPGRRLCRILINESTKGYLGDRFLLDRIGEVCVKGKEQTLMVYRVIGHARDVTQDLGELASREFPGSTGAGGVVGQTSLHGDSVMGSEAARLQGCQPAMSSRERCTSIVRAARNHSGFPRIIRTDEPRS